MAEKRKRGVYLDKGKVRIAASGLSLSTLTALEIRYINYFKIPEGQIITAPRKAWNGEKLDKRYATKIANVLGLTDYISLLSTQKTSPWEVLLENPIYRVVPCMKFQPMSEAENKLINLENFQKDSPDDLDKISVKQNWCVNLQGKSGDQFLLILKSQDINYQLAPLNTKVDEYLSIMPKRAQRLRYPKKNNFTFDDKYGLGKRSCIVIRAQSLPILAKSIKTGFSISQKELDEFALRLMMDTDQQIVISEYEFQLVE